MKDLGWKNLLRIELTDKGREFHGKLTNKESIDYLMSALTREEQKQIWVLLAKIRRRAVKKLSIKEKDLYPPSDLSKLTSLDKTT